MEINAWIGNETEGIISDVIKPESMDSSTELILIDVLYFQGEIKIQCF